MHQLYCTLVILAVALNNPLLCWGFPGFEMGGMYIGGNQGGITITGSGPAHENGFYIITNGNTQSNGKCIQNIEVHGNGFIDNFKTLCPTNNGFNLLNTDVGTFYGSSNSLFILYSYEPSSIVVIENGICAKKVYTTTGQITKSEKKSVSDKECKEIKKKIADREEEKNRKHGDQPNKTNFPSNTNENSQVTGNNKWGKKPEESTSKPANGNSNGFSISPSKPVHGSHYGTITGVGNTYVHGDENYFSMSPDEPENESPEEPEYESPEEPEYESPEEPEYENQHGSITSQGITINGNLNGMMVSAGEAEHDNGFYIITNGNTQSNGKCIQNLEVHKNTFTVNFEAPCSNKVLSMLNTHVGTFSGGSDSPFTLYSNEPSSIVVIENGKCTKNVYTTKGKTTTSVKNPVGNKECKAIKQDIAEGEEENRKYWGEWHETTFPPGFPFSDDDSSTTTNDEATGKKKSKKNKSKSKRANGNNNGFSISQSEPIYGNQHGSISGFGNTYVYGNDKDSGVSTNPGFSISGTNHGSMSGFGNTYIYGDEDDFSMSPGMSTGGSKGGITISGSGPAHENGFYIITSGNTQSNGKCIQNLEVHGNGFVDNFETLCPTNGFTMLNTDVGTFYGGSNNLFTLYSYEPSSLVVIENGKCKKKVYTTTGRKTTSETKPVIDKECNAIKQKIAKREEEDRKHGDGPNHTTNFFSTTNENSKVTENNKSGKKPEKYKSSSYINKNTFTVNNKWITEDGECLQKITVGGNGYTDEFKVPCSNQGMNMFSTEDGTIYGGSNQPLTLYSDDPTSLVVVQDGKCKRKTYPTFQESVMDPKKCNDIKQKITGAEKMREGSKALQETNDDKKWYTNFFNVMMNALKKVLSHFFPRLL